ncbi:acyltransferase [Mucilaginibacter limnophilus]|uniref:Acyltransferase n=1 Tax=Mucilaginibacter limnophilus TaxID=1932778 RepID=A0A437MQ21_9SPHI|nr:acyltransferase [Mucilaginibacter limnophilus]RVT99749.1 acyltransferase [Mucilaginibacter limnophilus]
MESIIEAPVTIQQTINRNETKIHLNYLDGLRAVLAMYVLLYHFMREVDVKTNLVARLISYPFIYGPSAVVAFIVLSGFCLMLPVTRNNNYLKGTTGNFIRKRAKRILPTYYLAMLFAIVLIVSVIDNNSATQWNGVAILNPKVLITHILLIHNIFGDTSRTINYCFWSIAVEWYIYFLFPPLVVFWRRLGAAKAMLISFAATLALCIVLAHSRLNLDFQAISPNFISCFALGMLACHLSFSENKIRLFFIKHKSSILVLPILAGLIVACEHFKYILRRYESPIYTSGSLTTDFLMALFICLLLIFLSINTAPLLKKILSFKPLVFIGTFAYSIYLIHAPIIEIFMRYIILPFHLRALPSIIGILLIGLPAILTVSWLFYLVAEKPFLKNVIPKKHHLDVKH